MSPTAVPVRFHITNASIQGTLLSTQKLRISTRLSAAAAECTEVDKALLDPGGGGARPGLGEGSVCKG